MCETAFAHAVLGSAMLPTAGEQCLGARVRVASTVGTVAMAKQVLIGRTGTVVIPIRGGDRPGEVRVTVDGMAHYYLAYAATAIPADACVLVIHDRGARHVDVEPWPTLPVDGDARGGTEGSP
jgi:membrane protein implicated in regulation of membrane protease activity